MQRAKNLLLLISIASILATGCKDSSNSSRPSVTYTGNTMGTTYKIVQVGDRIVEQEKIDSLLRQIDTALSTYNPESYISAFNANQDLSKFPHSAYLRFSTMLRLSQKLHDLTYDAFDPSAGSLFNYWGFGEDGPNPKGGEEKWLQAAQSKGLRDIVDVGSNFGVYIKDEKVKLNFNAIAKGFGVDEVAALLVADSCFDFMVEIGGEVYCGGKNPDGEPWSIGINTPSSDAGKNDVTQIIQLSDQAIATSGNYRNFYNRDGKIYGHSIDPRTGDPANNEVLSASIIAPTCAEADAWATAAMVLGKDTTLSLLSGDTTNPDVFQRYHVYLIYVENNEIKDTAQLADGMLVD